MVKLKSEKIKGVLVKFTKLNSGVVVTEASGKGGLLHRSLSKKEGMTFARKRFNLFDKLVKKNPKLTQAEYLKAARKKGL